MMRKSMSRRRMMCRLPIDEGVWRCRERVCCGWCWRVCLVGGVGSCRRKRRRSTDNAQSGGGSRCGFCGPAENPQPVGRALRWQDAAGQPQQVELPCEGVGLLVTTAQAFVACGAQGLVVVRFEGAVVELRQRRVAGQVVGVFESDGQVWLKITKQEALPMAEAFFGRASRGAFSGGGCGAAPNPSRRAATSAPSGG